MTNHQLIKKNKNKTSSNDFEPDEYDLAIFEQWDHIKDINEYNHKNKQDNLIFVIFLQKLLFN